MKCIPYYYFFFNINEVEYATVKYLLSITIITLRPRWILFASRQLDEWYNILCKSWQNNIFTSSSQLMCKIRSKNIIFYFIQIFLCLCKLSKTKKLVLVRAIMLSLVRPSVYIKNTTFHFIIYHVDCLPARKIVFTENEV